MAIGVDVTQQHRHKIEETSKKSIAEASECIWEYKLRPMSSAFVLTCCIEILGFQFNLLVHAIIAKFSPGRFTH
jgi:hypothetical protein